MSIRKIAIAALVATSMASMPVVAQAAKARHAAVAKVAAVKKDASHAGTDTGTLVIAALGTAAVIGGIVAISNNNGPSSP